MIKREVWEDKLPEDKVRYYNRTRMSLELFSDKIGIAPQVLRRDLERSGYYYNKDTRTFGESPVARAIAQMKRLHHL